MGSELSMYQTTFRILESNDEHFYSKLFGYHWYLNGFHLPDAELKAIYHENAAHVLGSRHLQ